MTQNMTTITETLNALMQRGNQQRQRPANQVPQGNQRRGQQQRQQAQQEEMFADGQGLDFEDGQPPMDEFLNIRVDENLLHAQQPNLGANANFELKPALIGLVSRQLFAGEEGENPHHHLRAFNRVAATVRIAGVDQSVISFMLFPFSLTGEARDWWDNQDHTT